MVAPQRHSLDGIASHEGPEIQWYIQDLNDLIVRRRKCFEGIEKPKSNLTQKLPAVR